MAGKLIFRSGLSNMEKLITEIKLKAAYCKMLLEICRLFLPQVNKINKVLYVVLRQ